MRKLFFAILSSFAVITLHAQDTTYYDANDKVVASLTEALYYKVVSKDVENPKWTKELVYYKSGKIKSEAILNSWKKDRMSTKYERVYKEWYESGQLHKEIGFSNGNLNGRVISYWENGKIKHEGYYLNEVLKEGKNYNSDGSDAPDGPYRKVAKYPGGYSEHYKYIYNNFIKVIQDRDTSFSGKLYLVFTVNKDGSTSDITVEKKVAPWIAEIGIQMVKNMPKWEPAVTDGEISKIQQTTPVNIRMKNDNSPFVIVEQMPEFPGGTDKMMRYLSNTIRYPVEAQMKKVQGMVITSFIVGKDGAISDIEVVRGIGNGCDDEAVRVIKNMPTWVPGKQGGQLVPVKFTLPIRFALR